MHLSVSNTIGSTQWEHPEITQVFKDVGESVVVHARWTLRHFWCVSARSSVGSGNQTKCMLQINRSRRRNNMAPFLGMFERETLSLLQMK